MFRERFLISHSGLANHGTISFRILYLSTPKATISPSTSQATLTGSNSKSPTSASKAPRAPTTSATTISASWGRTRRTTRPPFHSWSRSQRIIILLCRLKLMISRLISTRGGVSPSRRRSSWIRTVTRSPGTWSLRSQRG